MKSSYELTKEKSIYHFDKNKTDPRWDTVLYLGKIIPNWKDDIKSIVENAKPATWETRGYKAKEVAIPQPELQNEEYDLIKAGMDPKMVITHLNWNIPDSLQKVSDLFGLENCMTRIHVQMPGEVWNLHIDKLQKWNPADPNSVARYMIQLTDWEPGQFWEYGNYHHNQWRAGDVTTFDWQNLPHSTANAGYHPRVTLQLTGIKTVNTIEFLSKLKEGEFKINT